MPSLTDLQRCGHRDTCATPSEVRGRKLESFDETQLKKVAGILETPSFSMLTAPCWCSRY